MHELERLGQVLDSAFAIPGTPFRIGLDGILGFIPGVGDTMGAALSTTLSGYLVQYYGWTSTFVVMSALAVVGAGLFSRINAGKRIV